MEGEASLDACDGRSGQRFLQRARRRVSCQSERQGQTFSGQPSNGGWRGGRPVLEPAYQTSSLSRPQHHRTCGRDDDEACTWSRHARARITCGRYRRHSYRSARHMPIPTPRTPSFPLPEIAGMPPLEAPSQPGPALSRCPCLMMRLSTDINWDWRLLLPRWREGGRARES